MSMQSTTMKSTKYYQFYSSLRFQLYHICDKVKSIMIEINTVFDDATDKIALWCGASMDGTELAQATQVIVEKNITNISLTPDVIRIVWPWVEKMPVKIMARFYFKDKKITDNQVSDVTEQINTAFKNGAHGAQVFLRYCALDSLVEQTHVIRDDLFFNRDLSIGLDISDVDCNDWENLFMNLRKINASSVLLSLNKDTGNKSDFVGRLYGMLNAWNVDNKFELHFAFGPNFSRIEQVLRLVKIMQPELLDRIKFWVNS